MHNRIGMTFLFKFRSRLKLQYNSGIGYIKLLPGNINLSHGRVYDLNPVTVKSAKNHKMTEIPMKNQRNRNIFERINRSPVATSHQTVISCSQNQVQSIASISVYGAILANLLKRNPFPVVSQYHIETGRTALRIFHHHNYRNIFDPSHMPPISQSNNILYGGLSSNTTFAFSSALMASLSVSSS